MSPTKSCCLVTAWFLIAGTATAQPLAITNEANSRLFSLNPDTGSTTLIGNSGVMSMRDLARAPDGLVYAASQSTLYAVNPLTAAATPIGLFAPVSPNMVGLDFTAAGQLFGVSSNGGVYQIDRTSGAATLRFTAPFSFEGDIAHESGNTFYATAAAGAASRLIAIDVMTQSATDRGAIAIGEDFPGLDFAADGRLLAFSRAGSVYHIPAYSTVAAGVLLSTTSVAFAGVTITPVPEPSALLLVMMIGVGLSKRFRPIV